MTANHTRIKNWRGIIFKTNYTIIQLDRIIKTDMAQLNYSDLIRVPATITILDKEGKIAEIMLHRQYYRAKDQRIII